MQRTVFLSFIVAVYFGKATAFKSLSPTVRQRLHVRLHSDIGCNPRTINGVKSTVSSRICSKIETPEGPSPRIYDLSLQAASSDSELIGEDAAAFSLEEQSLKSWGIFTAAVATVLSIIFVGWVYEGDGGLHLGNVYKDWMEGMAGGESTFTIT